MTTCSCSFNQESKLRYLLSDLQLPRCGPSCDVSTVLALLSGLVSSNVNRTDGQGRTPLHYAAFHGRAQTVQLLLDLGAAADPHDCFGLTPLCMAVLGGKPGCDEVCMKLKRAHARLRCKVRGLGDATVLHLAVTAAAAKGATTEGATAGSSTVPSPQAVTAAGLVEVSEDDCTAGLRGLLAAGCKPDLLDGTKRTALSHAVNCGSTAAVAGVLAAGATVQVGTRLYRGMRPTENWPSHWRMYAVMSWLLQCPLLFTAALQGNAAMVQLLLQAGAIAEGPEVYAAAVILASEADAEQTCGRQGRCRTGGVVTSVDAATLRLLCARQEALNSAGVDDWHSKAQTADSNMSAHSSSSSSSSSSGISSGCSSSSSSSVTVTRVQQVPHLLLRGTVSKQHHQPNVNTPLHLAARSGLPAVVALPLSHGAPVDARGKGVIKHPCVVHLVLGIWL